MNKKQILIIIAVFIVGGFLGSRIQELFSGNDNSPPQNSKQANTKHEVIYMIRDKAVNSENDVNEVEPSLEKLLSGANYNFKFYFVKELRTGQKKAVKAKQAKVDMAPIDASRIIQMEKNGKDLKVLFKASPDPDFECYSEAQFFTKSDSEIKTIKDIKHKNVAILNVAIPFAGLRLKELGEEIEPINKLIVIKNVEEGLELLKENKVDVVAYRINVFENNKIEAFLGDIVDNQYTNHPELKIIETTSSKIPCKIIYIMKSVPENIITEVKTKFTDVFTAKENKQVLKKGLGLGSIKELSNDEWEKIKEIYTSHGSIKLRSLSNEIAK